MQTFLNNPVLVISTLVCFIGLTLLGLFALAFLVTVLGEPVDRYQDINDEEGAHSSERNNKTAR